MNIIETQKKSISSLYILKALCAFFVVVIHFPMKYGYLFYPIIYIAVPCFFMISGYFLYSDDRKDMISKLSKTICKTLYITLLAYAFYIIVKILLSLLFGTEIGLTSDSLLKITLAGPTIWATGHLWYLVAYLETLFVILLLVWFRSLKLVWILIPLGLITNLLMGKYGFLLPIPSDLMINDVPKYMLARNFFTIGIPAFSIGLIIRKYNQMIIQTINKHNAWIISGLLLLFSIVEFTILYSLYGRTFSGDIAIFTVPFSISLIIICLHYKEFGNDTIFEIIGKKYSSDIYIYHMFVASFIIWLIEIILGKLFGGNWNFLYSAFIIFFATLIFVIIWQRSIYYVKNILHIKSAKI